MASYTEHISPVDRKLIAQNKLFREVQFDSIEYMLEYSTVRRIHKGSRLLHPETANHYLFLILEGEFSVQLESKEKFATLTSGDCAGEISMIDRKFPTATVIATQESRVLAVPQHTIWSLVGYSHEVARNLLEIMAGRIRYDKVNLLETQKENKQFQHQATVDSLTGVYNRHWLTTGFTRLLQRCHFEQKPFAILMVDIDNFKKINDAYGHLVGDMALKAVAKVITESLRSYDLLVRYGGEEFTIFLFDSSPNISLMVANRLRANVNHREVSYEGANIPLTVSVGVRTTNYQETLEKLIEQADQALYQAKIKGKNRVEVYTD